MKFKFLFFVFCIFLASFSSAVVSYSEWPGQTDSLTINDGDTTQISVTIFSLNPKVDYSIKLYDMSYNLIHTFESGSFDTNTYHANFNLNQGIYGGDGNYKVVVACEDKISSYTSEANLIVNFVDNEDPVITLLGSNPQQIIVGNSYVELGATATDNVDGDLTSQIVIDNSSVDVNSVGNYLVSYYVEDSSGNSDIEYRDVNVVAAPIDTVPPVITLVGQNPVNIYGGSFYTDAGATATDNVDGDITSQIVTTNPVDTNVVGTYTVRYNVNDSAGNAAIEVTRTVNVVALPNGYPVITLNGLGEINVSYNSSYNDLGASATDAEDGDLTSQIVVNNSVDTNVLGTYYVTYDVNDSDGHDAVQRVRIVHVVSNADNDAPIITVIYPEDGRTYYYKSRTFKVKVNEDSEVWYSINGKSNKSMSDIGNLKFQEIETLSYGSYTVVFYAKDLAGNWGSEEVSFKIRSGDSSNSHNNNQTAIDYFSPSISNESSNIVLNDKDSNEFKPGYLLLLILGIGILIILILITLIVREKNSDFDEQKRREMIDEKSDEIVGQGEPLY